jgi:hypothetical protein
VGPFGWGLVVVGGIAVLLGLLDLPRLSPVRRANDESRLEREQRAQHDERVAELLAIVPLLLFAGTGVAAAIDAALAGGKAEGLTALLPAIVLAAIAVWMTADRPPQWVDAPRAGAILFACVIVALVAVLLNVADSELSAAIVGVGAALAAVRYVHHVFHVRPPCAERTSTDCCVAYSVAVAGAVGLGMLLAVNWHPFGSARTLGTLAVVSVGFAFWIAVLNWFQFRTYDRRPPRALWWVGLDRLPIVTLIVVAWIAAGAIATPATIHETRLVERSPVATKGATAIPPTPTIDKAFASWVAAQPELNGKSGGRPVPMLLVAAHGGGIRAAYWTGLALDCIVGVSGAGFDRDVVIGHGDAAEKARAATCTSPRRTQAQQQVAARRIFLASGVSGGAVGLYAYARQLITKGWLGRGTDDGPGAWVDKRLGLDFASPTIGWQFFHDAVAHWFGAHSHRGGDCGGHLTRSICLTQDRGAILERSFDAAWRGAGTPAFAPNLRLTWDLRSSRKPKLQKVARLVPLLAMNTTLTGGKARGVVSAVNFGSWPQPDTRTRPQGELDKLPLAGTVDVVQAICLSRDLRLSTAAVLAGRFPYVSPAGHISGHCRRSKGSPLGGDKGSACALVKAEICAMRLVDGGYAENSGLFTIDVAWPSIRRLVGEYNRKKSHRRKIAPVIVELDNHYQSTLERQLPGTGPGAETVIPLATAFGARNAQETFARALAVRLRPAGCTLTISPGMHPGLTAPLGWELSKRARDDLFDGLTRPHPTAVADVVRARPVLRLRQLQQWLGGEHTADMLKLGVCVPGSSAK